MTRKSHFILVLGGLFLLASCGGEAKDAKNKTTEGADSKPKIMTPMNASEFEPIPAKDLLDTWTAWSGKEVQVTGYLDLFFDKGKLSFQSAKLVSKPGGDKVLVEAKLLEMDENEYDRNVPVTIKGKIKGTWGFDGAYHAYLIDAKIVKNGAEIPTEKLLDPENLNEPVSAQALYNNYIGWLGKEVTVIGNANGVTTSTTSYGVTIRVDLTDPNSAFTKYCGVRVKDESHAQSAKDASNKERKYRGEFIGDCFSMVCIENAVEVK